MPPVTAPIEPVENDFLDDDEEGWQEMPVVREDTEASGMDEEDQKRYHYKPSAKGTSAANATGSLLDIDSAGTEWREKADRDESEYTRLRAVEEDETDEVHLRTKYLFDEDKAMTPLSQMQATKNLLTEAQRIAYVGLCSLTAREMSQRLKEANRKELKSSIADMDLWALKIMGRMYYHMEILHPEQKMIESLAVHGVEPMDLVPALMTTHTVANPEYDPEEARRQREEELASPPPPPYEAEQTITVSSPKSPPEVKTPVTSTEKTFQTTARVLEDTTTTIPGVSTTLSSADKNVTLDIRWTVLCDLFLILIADSVYDARSRVLLESVALKLGLGWLDVVKFESRVTEALEIQEDVEKMENEDVVEERQKAARKKRYMMMGLATLGGGLVIGLSAGLLAPVIGAGLGAAFTAVGITGTGGFLAGAGGAAVITTGGVLTGSSIAGKGMARRTQLVRTFVLLPLHNNKRVSCILTVPGFMDGELDDPRLPFSVLDPIVGDVFSVLWEPEMIRETGSALRIMSREVLTQIGQTVLQATLMTGLMTALQWPIILTKLGYLIDNPWSNALDRAKAAGSVLAHVLMQRHLGVRPVTLIGFSLGARMIFYALLELAKNKAYGVVQDVFLLGATLTASAKTWCESRSVVSGRYVNCYARNDWVLNYLFRATSGGVGTVAGLREVKNVPGLENVDVTDKISGHMSYRVLMPLILDQLGFPVFADYFDDPVEPDFEGDRVVEREEEQEQKGWFGKKKQPKKSTSTSRPPSGNYSSWGKKSSVDVKSPPTIPEDDDLPPREGSPASKDAAGPSIPKHAGFDLAAMKEVLGQAGSSPSQGQPEATVTPPPVIPPANRTVSAPILATQGTGSTSLSPPASPSPGTPRARDRLSPPPSPSPIPSPSVSPSTLPRQVSRSKSINDMKQAVPYDSPDEEEETDFRSTRAAAPPAPPKDPFSIPAFSSFANPSTASLSNPYGSSISNQASSSTSWSPPPLSLDNPFANPAVSSRVPTLSFGGDGGQISFADQYTSPALSFGAVDGSIAGFSSSGGGDGTSRLDDDKWKVPSHIGQRGTPRRGDSGDANPWG